MSGGVPEGLANAAAIIFQSMDDDRRIPAGENPGYRVPFSSQPTSPGQAGGRQLGGIVAAFIPNEDEPATIEMALSTDASAGARSADAGNIVSGFSDGFTPNADGTVTGPQGASYIPVPGVQNNGLQVYSAGSEKNPYYVTLDGGLQSSAAPSMLSGATPGSIVAASYAAHDATSDAVAINFRGQGATVQESVKLTASNGAGETVYSLADQVLIGQPSATYQVPEGLLAEDTAGNPLTNLDGSPMSSFQLNSEGYAIVEIKTGQGPLTGNQSVVYPAAEAGNAMGAGPNAETAGIDGPITTPISVIILRKK